MSSASSRSSKGGTIGGTDPLVKDKEELKKITPKLIKFLSEVPYVCNDIDFKKSLPQLRNLPTARLVREIYNFFFETLLNLSLEKKGLTEVVLDYLKVLDYPYVIPKSSITSPNNSSSWPYNLAAFVYLRDLYVASSGEAQGDGIDDCEIDVFDDDFMKSFAVMSTESEEFAQVKRMTNIMASSDLCFRTLDAEVKDLEVAKKSLLEEQRSKQAKFAHLFGSLEEFEEALRTAKEQERYLDEVREQVEEDQKEQTDCLLACRRVTENIQTLRDEWIMKLKLEFPSFCAKLGEDFFSNQNVDAESKKLCEMTSELRLDLDKKTKQALQKKAELKETMSLKETSIFRLRHEHETMLGDCRALQERIDKIRENIDRFYKVIDRCESKKKEQTKLRDQLLQKLQQDHKTAQLLFAANQSALDQFVDQMKELDDYIKGGGTEQVGLKKKKKIK